MAVQVKNSVIKNVGTVPVIVSETDASKRQTILGLSITNLTDGFLYIDVLLDDIDENISNKFKKHDLLGIPFQIIIGSKATKDQFEFKEIDKDSQMLDLNKIIKILKN